MSRPTQLDAAAVSQFISEHEGWSLAVEGALTRSYPFSDFAAALAFAVRVGCLAEKRDHHPELKVSWGKVGVTWSTHDAGGITRLDVAAAEATDAAFR